MIYTTKSGMRFAEIGDTVDFTRFRVGTHIGSLRIVVCPTCGRHALKTSYLSAKLLGGTRNIIGHGYSHSQHHVGFAWELRDTCTVWETP